MILKYQSDMSGLNRLRITDHEILGDGIAVTTYENGTKVYVNYTEVDYQDGAIKIPAREYVVKGGKQQ